MEEEFKPNQTQDITNNGFPKVGYDNPGYQKDEKTEKVDHKKRKGKESKANKSIGYFELFRFADRFDILMIIIGILCAIAHGISRMLVTVIFGRLTDNFVQSGTPLNISSAGTELYCDIN
ncbi:multidrug resistance protein 2-like [Rhinoraja longicauda]